MKILCQCGQSFETTEQRRAEGRGRYCSKTCMYAYRTRPSGLTYNIVAVNRAWFAKGRDEPKGPAAIGWKGDLVGYRALHNWVRTVRPKPTVCEWCGTEGYTEWANLSHEYRRIGSDWAALCRLCHRHHDSGPARGKASAKYGVRAVQVGL